MGGYYSEAFLSQVELALSQVGLRHVADTLVGGVVERGISGGEKRRLSIALQLIQDPGQIFRYYVNCYSLSIWEKTQYLYPVVISSSFSI